MPTGKEPGWPDWANFRPSGDCLLWVVFVKITEVAPIIGLLFLTVTVLYYVFITTNGLGYILGDFFTNASGHPGRNVKGCRSNPPRTWTWVKLPTRSKKPPLTASYRLCSAVESVKMAAKKEKKWRDLWKLSCNVLSLSANRFCRHSFQKMRRVYVDGFYKYVGTLARSRHDHALRALFEVKHSLSNLTNWLHRSIWLGLVRLF
jgi:hypothetical protein